MYYVPFGVGGDTDCRRIDPLNVDFDCGYNAKRLLKEHQILLLRECELRKIDLKDDNFSYTYRKEHVYKWDAIRARLKEDLELERDYEFLNDIVDREYSEFIFVIDFCTML